MNRRGNKRAQELEDEEPDVDDDGRPLTIGAAQRLFHKNGDKIYLPNATYRSRDEANSVIINGQMRIKKLIENAKIQHMSHIGGALGEAVKTDIKVANMPQIRIMHKNKPQNYF